MQSRRSIACMLLAAVCFVSVSVAGAFSIIPNPRVGTIVSSTSLDMFGGLGDAFKNDDSLGKRQNAGLSKGPKGADVTINGKAVPNVVVGQKVKDVARKARVKIQYSCQKGDCGTCTIQMNGRMVKACQEKVPSGKCVINTLS